MWLEITSASKTLIRWVQIEGRGRLRKRSDKLIWWHLIFTVTQIIDVFVTVTVLQSQRDRGGQALISDTIGLRIFLYAV